MATAPTRGSSCPSAFPRIIPPKGGFKPIGSNAIAASTDDDDCWAHLMDVIGCDDAAIEMISSMEQEAAVREQQQNPSPNQNNDCGVASNRTESVPSYSWGRPRNSHFTRSMTQHNQSRSSAPLYTQQPQPTHYHSSSFGAPENFIYQVNMDPNSSGQGYHVTTLPAESANEMSRAPRVATPESPPIKTLTFPSFPQDNFAPLSPSSHVSFGSFAPSVTHSGSSTSPYGLPSTDQILSSIPAPPLTSTHPSRPPMNRSASYGGPGKCLSTLQEHRRQQEEEERERILKEQEAEERERMRKAQEAAALAFAHKRAVAIAAQKAQAQANTLTCPPSNVASACASAAPSSSPIIEKESAPIKVVSTFRELKKEEFDFHSGAADKAYYDFSNITEEEQALPPEERNTGGVVAPFPLRLHDMLYQDKFPDIITWAPHGRAFIVHKPKEFEARVLCRYFNQTKYRSFQRQLNLYGFRRISGGDTDRGAYYHELFLRGRRKLCTRMKRRAVKGPIYRPIFEPELEPNFYAMAPLNDNGPEDMSKKPAAVPNQTPALSVSKLAASS